MARRMGSFSGSNRDANVEMDFRGNRGGVRNRGSCIVVRRRALDVHPLPLPVHYRSTAILKIEPAFNTEALNRVVDAAFAPQALSDIIRQEHLYGEAPIDRSIDRLRRAILIKPAGSNLAQVSFAYENPAQAQQVTQNLIGRIISANVNPSVNPNGLRIEFDAPPGPPKRQFEGKRLSLVGLGLPTGMLFGVVLALILRRRRARTAS